MWIITQMQNLQKIRIKNIKEVLVKYKADKNNKENNIYV